VQGKQFKDEASVVMIDCDLGRARLATITLSQIHRLLQRRQNMGSRVANTPFARQPHIGIAHQLGAREGLLQEHMRNKDEDRLEWLALCRVRGIPALGRDMSAEGIVREALRGAGITMLPSPAFDGFADDNIAVHSVIHLMQNADVSSAPCKAALAKMYLTDLRRRDELGLGGRWFFGWLSRMHGDIMLYAGV
jgi:DNA-binding transcriptional LysR family regulator